MKTGATQNAMIAGKLDPQHFFQDRNNVALRVPAAEIFGLLKRTLNLPPAWAAMVRLAGGALEVIRAGGEIDGRDADDVLFVRVTPLELAFQENGLLSRDGFDLRADVRLSLRLTSDRAELSAFQETVLGSRRVVQLDRIAAHLRAKVQEGLARHAGEHDGASLIDSARADAASAAIGSAIETDCFAGGLSLEAPPVVRFNSDTVRQVQNLQRTAAVRQTELEVARQTDQVRQKAREEHLDSLGSTLARLRELADASRDAEIPDLLRTFSEKQRGELYEAWFASEQPASLTRWIVVAAAEELLFFDPRHPMSPARRLRIDGPAGPARSVRRARLGEEVVLLVGAATGVYVWPIDASAPRFTLLVPNAPRVRGGFNAAVSVRDHVVATHSELGIGQWDVGCMLGTHPRAVRLESAPYTVLFESMTRGAKAVRDVEVLDDTLYCAVDDRILGWSKTCDDGAPQRALTGSGSIISALCATADGVFAGNGDGDVLRWSAAGDADPELIHRGNRRPAESVCLMVSHGVRRLIHADTSPRISARVLGDSFVCHYEAGGQTLRRVEVADDLIVATNEVRDRLILWSPNRPEKPDAVIQVGALTGHSVQDVCLISAPADQTQA